MHVSNVALVYNPETKHVNPQFRVTFDDDFSSVTIEDQPTVDDGVMERLLQGPQWVYGGIFEPPTGHHLFEVPHDLSLHKPEDLSLLASSSPPSAQTAPPLSFMATVATSTAKLIYKPVRASAAFVAWKQGIAAELFEYLSQKCHQSCGSTNVSRTSSTP
jgi:hypothetical protein